MNMNILKWINDKIDKSQIKNTLIETDTGNVLDASQGKVLNDKIIDLSDNRGYLNTKHLLDDVDFNDIPKLNGLYMFTSNKNSPLSTFEWYFVQVTVHNETYLTQEAWKFASDKSEKWIRTLHNNVWNSWVKMASVEDVEILLNNKKFIRSDANTEGRDTPTKPSDYILRLFTNQIKTFACMGIPGSGFVHTIGINEWTDCTAGVHELIFAGSKLYYRVSANADTWGPMYELSGISKTDILPSSLLNGWQAWDTNYGDKVIIYKSGNHVQLNGLLRCGTKDHGTVILTLPEGLRPIYNIIKNVSCYPYGTATLEIQSVGNIIVGNIGADTLGISMTDIMYSTQN